MVKKKTKNLKPAEMPPKTDAVEDFIRALSDKRVQDLIGDIVAGRLKDCLAEIDCLKRENIENKRQIDVLTKNLSDANSKIDALEAYNRRDNIIISGLPVASFAEIATTTDQSGGGGEEEHAADTERSVLALCQELQVPLSPADISIAHRLKKKPNNPGPAAVIVRFTSRKAREMVYAARYKLKNRHGVPVYINEDLTKPTAELFAKARKLVKDRVIHSAWTSGGVVNIKKTSDPSCRPCRVHSANDLSRI